MATPSSTSSAAAATITNYLELRSPYDYTPELAPGLAFTIAFGLTTLIHCGIAMRYKNWAAFATLVPGGLLEIIGWAGRLWSHYSVLDSDPFIMQMCCLIVGPAFFSAWAYTVLGYCIVALGPAYSLLNPKAYLAIFVTADAVCLVLQAIGGGLAAVAAEAGTDTDTPTRIMLAGVLVQLGTMTIFSILAVDFIARVISRRPYAHRVQSLARHGLWSGAEVSPSTLPPAGSDAEKHTPAPLHGPTSADRARQLRKTQLLLIGTAFASAMLYGRGVYRSIELAQGWTGELMTHEVYFVYLDGVLVVLGYAAFAALNPGWLIEK